MSRFSIQLLLLLLLISAFPMSLRAATLLVPSEYATVQQAVGAASDGDTVMIEPGRYTGPGFREIRTFGKAIHIRSMAGPEQTILDGEFDGALAIFDFRDGETSATIVEGLTITGGIGFELFGGGIDCYGASPTIRDCLIARNASDGFITAGGGGINIQDSSPTIEGCTITCNDSQSDARGGYGDGLRISGDSHPVLRNCVVQGNDIDSLEDIYIGSLGTLVVECSVLGVVTEVEPGSLQIDEHTVFADPEFCAPACDPPLLDPTIFRVSVSSVCLPGNNSCGELIGALGIGCPVTEAPDVSAPPALILVYPNPARDILHLELAPRLGAEVPDSHLLTVRAFDSSGRLAAELLRGVSQPGGGPISIDLQSPGRELGAGVYVLEIAVNGEVHTEKLTVR